MVIPALAAGATVVLKPAGLTPLTAFELARAIDAAGLPAGVFNLVPGSGRVVGDHLVRHPGVDQISFTGSTPVGRQIAVAAAETLKRVTLELGGKSASVVLHDADDALLAKAVKITVGNCYLNGGQTCTALSRLIVPAARIEDAAIPSGVSILWEPFLLGPIFAEQGWDDSPFNVYPAKGRYMWRDMERLCSGNGIPFEKPSRFPRSGVVAARVAWRRRSAVIARSSGGGS